MARTTSVLPDVFVYRRPFDIFRPSLALAQDGPPALVVEVLSPENWDSDIDLAQGKPWSYADAGVAEYLVLDPASTFLDGERGRGWRLEAGSYVPWEPDAAGRWVSALGFAIGYEGAWAVVYGVDGRRIPPEGRILRSLARERGAGRAAGLVEGEARGHAAGLPAKARARAGRDGAHAVAAPARAALRRGARGGGGALERIEDPALLEGLADLALDAPDAAFLAHLPPTTEG